MKLYLVVLCGTSLGDHRKTYVVANNPDEAYKTVRKFLDEKNLGFENDRDLFSVELITELINTIPYLHYKKHYLLLRS